MAPMTVVSLLQLMLEIVYGAVFNPNDPDMIVVIGKEHLGWWIVYPENNAIQLQRKADYQVPNCISRFVERKILI